jgi:hypothetical protein
VLLAHSSFSYVVCHHQVRGNQSRTTRQLLAWFRRLFTNLSHGSLDQGDQFFVLQLLAQAQLLFEHLIELPQQVVWSLT